MSLFQKGARMLPFSIVLLASLGASARGAQTLPLSALTPSSNQQSWGNLAYDRSVQGHPLKIAGRTFVRGLGTHARSEIVYDLEAPCERFEAWVGVDDEMDYRKEASVVFRVFADGREVASSPVMHAKDKAVRLAASLKGVTELRLVVDDAGDGVDSDHADWGDTRIIGTLPKRTMGKPRYSVRGEGIEIALSDSGQIVGMRLAAPGGRTKPVRIPATGEFQVVGTRPSGSVKAARLKNGGIEFSENLVRRSDGRTCRVIQRFSPWKMSIRWTVEIRGDGSPWTAPLSTRLYWPATSATRFWTPWGDPDGSTDRWQDPLETRPFADRSLTFGGSGNAANAFAIPLATALEPKSGVALSIAPSLNDTLLDLSLSTRKDGEFAFLRRNHRIDDRRPLRFSVDLVPQAPDVRSGLAWLTYQYPKFFNPPNPNAADVAGCGAYSTFEGQLDAAQMKRMGFRVNWKASFDFPYMGMFLPPMKGLDDRWPRFDADSGGSLTGKKTFESRRTMSDYSHRMREQGFRVLNYFNVTEFGASIGAPDTARKDLENGDLWKDPTTFLYRRIADGILTDGKGGRFGTWGGAVAMDPGGPDYRKFLLEQARRHVDWLPASSGICIDRTDWLSRYNPLGNDGESWIDGHPARSLLLSWRRLMARLAPLFHGVGKSIFVNPLYDRIDLWRQVDGFYAEFGGNPSDFNASAMAGLFKPVIEWTPSVDTLKPDPDRFFQRHLYMGVFPTAPVPGNDHTITPDAWAERWYLDYGPLLTTLRGRRWVLRPQPVEVEGDHAKANLFTVPDGYALPVVFGDKSAKVRVVVHGVSAKDFQWSAVLPGKGKPTPVRATQKGNDAILDAPLVRGCAMVTGKKR
jgi:hypothetical protein